MLFGQGGNLTVVAVLSLVSKLLYRTTVMLVDQPARATDDVALHAVVVRRPAAEKCSMNCSLLLAAAHLIPNRPQEAWGQLREYQGMNGNMYVCMQYGHMLVQRTCPIIIAPVTAHYPATKQLMGEGMHLYAFNFLASHA